MAIFLGKAAAATTTKLCSSAALAALSVVCLLCAKAIKKANMCSAVQHYHSFEPKLHLKQPERSFDSLSF